MKSIFNPNRPYGLKWTIFIAINLFLTSVLLSGCGSVISQSTVSLSASVGSRIAEMEGLHQLAIQRYFDTERDKIENFLTQTWEPLFLKNFLGTSQVLKKIMNSSYIDTARRSQLQEAFKIYLTDPIEAEKATEDLLDKLNDSRKTEVSLVRDIVSLYIEDNKVDAAIIQITSLLGTDEPARIIFDFAEAAHIEMNARRKALLAPLQQLQAETMAELSTAYAELIRGQSTITGRLEAAAKVTQEQDNLLNTLGFDLTTKEIKLKLSEFTSIIDGALSLANKVKITDNEDISRSDNILKTLKEELQKINNPSIIKKSN